MLADAGGLPAPVRDLKDPVAGEEYAAIRDRRADRDHDPRPCVH